MNINFKCFFCIIFTLFPYVPFIGAVPSLMFDNKYDFTKESIRLYERYKRNKDPCYTEVIEMLETKCSNMDPSTKIMMAAHLMNCQYVSAGRTTHWFNETCSNQKECLTKVDSYFKDLGSDDYNIEMIALYFTHVDIICYYINRMDWNTRYSAQLQQISTLSEEIWSQLEKVQQQNYELLAKQNNSKNIIQTLSYITANSYNYVKNASNNLVFTLSNMNISADNSKHLLMDTLGAVFDVFYQLEQLIRASLWNMHKFGGILFFVVLSIYILFITNITDTKYTRTKLLILLWLMFVVDASMVFFVINNQPLKHLNKYLVVVRAFFLVAINLMWALFSYYIPRWIPLSNMDITYFVNLSNHSSRDNSLKKSLDATSDIERAQRKTLSIIKDARMRRSHLMDSEESNDDTEHYVTGIEQLPKPMTSVVTPERPSTSMFSTSAKYFHNVVDSINLVSPARRIFGSFHPSFATSTVIRESTNRKPLSPQVLKRTTSNTSDITEGTFNVNSPFTFKVPIKNIILSENDDNAGNVISSTAASFYGNKAIPPPSKPQSTIGEEITSSVIHSVTKRKPVGRRAIRKVDYNTDSDIATEESSEPVKKRRGRKPGSKNKVKSRIPTSASSIDAKKPKTNVTTRKAVRRSSEPTSDE